MKKIFAIILGIVLIGIIAGLFVFAYVDSLPEKVVKVTNSTPTPTIPVNYSNFAKVISGNSIVKSVPAGSTMLIKFYNLDSGSKTIEKSYLVSTGKIVEGEGKADIVILLDSKYLEELTNKNFCAIIEKANQNGDLRFETNLSSVALAWKLKSMYKYKDCLGA
ncbi:MAG: hypothetical protein WCI72_01900 [archaeon]